MSSINPRSISTLGLSASTSRITTKQDAVQARIQAASSHLQAANDGVTAAESARSRAQDELDALASKPKGKDYEKKYQAAVTTLNLATVNLERARRDQQKAKEELLNAKNALPAAIAADQQANQANRAADEKHSEQIKTQEQQARENKEASDKNTADEATKPEAQARAQTQGQGKGKAPSAAAVVGSAAAGGEVESAPAAQTSEGAPAPRAERDGYSAPAPKSGGESRQAARAPGGSTGVLTDEETQETGRAPAHAFVATNKAAVGDKPAAGASPALSIDDALKMAEESTMDDDVVTDTGKHYSQLNQAEKNLVDETLKKTLEAAKKGNYKKIEENFYLAFNKLGGESGVAEGDDSEGLGSGKSGKKDGKKTSLGAAAKGKNLSSGTAVGGSGPNVTAAGNGAASVQSGATGATVGTSDRPAISELAAVQTGKPMVGSSLQGGGKSGQGKATIGAAPTVGATDAGSAYDPIVVTENSEIGKGYNIGISPMELVQMVMLKAFQVAGDAVRGAAEMMQKQTDAKAAVRAKQVELRSLVVYTDGALSSVAAEGAPMSAKVASDQLSSLDGNIDAIGDDNQILMIRLQNLTQLMTTFAQATSNMSKSAYDTTKAVVGQIGH